MRSRSALRVGGGGEEQKSRRTRSILDAGNVEALLAAEVAADALGHRLARGRRAVEKPAVLVVEEAEPLFLPAVGERRRGLVGGRCLVDVESLRSAARLGSVARAGCEGGGSGQSGAPRRQRQGEQGLTHVALVRRVGNRDDVVAVALCRRRRERVSCCAGSLEAE